MRSEGTYNSRYFKLGEEWTYRLGFLVVCEYDDKIKTSHFAKQKSYE